MLFKRKLQGEGELLMIEQDEVTKRFPCGDIIKGYENAKAFIIPVQIVYACIAGYFFWGMLEDYTFIGKLDNLAVIMFCLWRIHKQCDMLCYATEHGLIVRRRNVSWRDFIYGQWNSDHLYTYIPYAGILMFSESWHEIQSGSVEAGGIAIIPTRLKFLSIKDKQEILAIVDNKQTGKNNKI